MSFAPKHILVPVDVDPMADRPLADRLVDDATAFAKLAGARLTLLHVALPIVSPMAPPIDLVTESYQAMLDVAEARNVASGRALEEMTKKVAAAGVEARPLLITRTGSIPDVIAQVAKEERADLVMLTTHGRRGLKRALLGSVAERTAHLAQVPVLLLPP